MVLEKPGEPLRMMELPMPHPRSDQVLVKVTACGVCRTDLHIVDGDLQHLPLGQASEALAGLRDRRLQGAAVLLPNQP